MNEMSLTEWKRLVLARLGLTRYLPIQEITTSLNGIQAQFQSYADVGFATRLSPQEFESNWQDQLVRQWSIRGTVHAYHKQDIGLYLHKDRQYFQTYHKDYYLRRGISEEAISRYQEVILQALQKGPQDRDFLKQACLDVRADDHSHDRLMSAWGGVFAKLVGDGLIYQVYGQRRFALLDHYQPWERQDAELEIMSRYLTGYGPVSLADIYYYFKVKKGPLKALLNQIAYRTVKVEGQERYYLGDLPDLSSLPDIPPVLQVAGFDALLLGYEKKENPFLNPAHIRQVYTMTGIVKPVLLINGQIKATWRHEKGKIMINPVEQLDPSDRAQVNQYFEQKGAAYAWEGNHDQSKAH